MAAEPKKGEPVIAGNPGKLLKNDRIPSPVGTAGAPPGHDKIQVMAEHATPEKWGYPFIKK